MSDVSPLHLAWGILAPAIFLLAPGVALVQRWGGVTATSDRIGLGIAVGTFVLSPTVAFVGMALHLPVGRPLVIVVGGSLLAALCYTRPRRPRSETVSDGPDGILTIGLAIAIFLTGLVAFPETFLVHPYCDYGLVWRLVGVPMGYGLPHDLFQDASHSRLGLPLMVAPFAGLAGPFGIRLFWALVHLSIFHGLRGLLRATLAGGEVARGRTPLLATVFAAAFTALPGLWGHLDLNIAALAAAVLVLALCVSAAAHPLLIGASFGSLWLTRHVAILCLPAFLLLLWKYRALRPRQALAVLAGALALAVPDLIRHTIAFGHPWAHEHFGYVDAPFSYSWIGLSFTSPAFLNWPFHESLVRSYGNPLPNLLATPLHLIHLFGAPLIALAPIGLVALCRPGGRSRILGLAALAWWALPYGFQALLENWTEVEKRDVSLFALPGLMILVASGLSTLLRPPARAPKTRALAYGACLAGVLGFPAIANRVEAPLDQRQLDFWNARAPFGELIPEPPDVLEIERARLQAPPWLPERWPAGRDPTPGGPGALQARIAASLRPGSFGTRRAALVERWGKALFERMDALAFDEGYLEMGLALEFPDIPIGDATWVHLDLGAPPSRFALRPTGPSREERADDRILSLLEANRFHSLRVPWSQHPISIARLPGSPPEPDLLLLWRGDPTPRSADTGVLARGHGSSLPTRGPLVIADVVSVEPGRAYFYGIDARVGGRPALHLESTLSASRHPHALRAGTGTR